MNWKFGFELQIERLKGRCACFLLAYFVYCVQLGGFVRAFVLKFKDPRISSTNNEKENSTCTLLVYIVDYTPCLHTINYIWVSFM